MVANEEYLVDLLVQLGAIGDDQAEEALEKAEEESIGPLKALEDLEFISQEDVSMILATEYGMETVNLEDYKVPPDVLSAVPADIAKKYNVLPISVLDHQITIALSDPTDIETLDSLRYILKIDVEGVIATPEQITKAVEKFYGSTEENINSLLGDLTEDNIDVEFGEGLNSGTGGDNERKGLEDDDSAIVRLVHMIIVDAYKAEASDIHLEPMEKKFRIRNRTDGVLMEVEAPPKYLQKNIISRLKIMAKLDITEKRVPQDGRISMKVLGKPIDLRVSTVPTTHGESIVMRILDKSSITLGIPELGFFADDQELIENILGLPDGIFLVTGPTGSGKTTSLYAFLNTINLPSKKIITAEDPVEYDLAGINQVQISAAIGMSFPLALRSMLRQAPNIIMVGEIRDMDTGAVAINAALTGHMVFSTLHTNDAPGAVTRLIDMGVQRFLVASALKAVMAQRLMRRICKSCKEDFVPTQQDFDFLGADPATFQNSEWSRGVGCSECKGGYKGRLGIYEIFMVGREIQDLIFEETTSQEIKDKARELGMRTLRDDGLRKAAIGATTIEEVIRLTIEDQE